MSGYKVYQNREVQYEVRREEPLEYYQPREAKRRREEEYEYEYEEYEEYEEEKDPRDLAEDILGVCTLIGFYFIWLHNYTTYGFI